MTRINFVSASLLAAMLSMIWFSAAAAGMRGRREQHDHCAACGEFLHGEFIGHRGQRESINQKFVVTYTDGSTTSITQSLSDWFSPQNYAGESQASKMAYRLTASGATQNGPFYLYGYSFAINSSKTVKSLACLRTVMWWC